MQNPVYCKLINFIYHLLVHIWDLTQSFMFRLLTELKRRVAGYQIVSCALTLLAVWWKGGSQGGRSNIVRPHSAVTGCVAALPPSSSLFHNRTSRAAARCVRLDRATARGILPGTTDPAECTSIPHRLKVPIRFLRDEDLIPKLGECQRRHNQRLKGRLHNTITLLPKNLWSGDSRDNCDKKSAAAAGRSGESKGHLT